MQEACIRPVDLLNRHVSGDWGDVCDEDKQLNDESVKDGSRILSAYTFHKPLVGLWKLWVITEAADDNGHRAATTILLPEEY